MRNACRFSRVFNITVALSRHAFPGWCISGHHPHGHFFFSLLTLHRRRNTNRCINLALPCRAIAAGFICSIQSYSRFSLHAPMYFLLRYRLTPVIYISVIIGKVFYPGLDENLFPSEVRPLPSPSSSFPSPSSSSSHFFLFFILAIIDFLVREASVLRQFCASLSY